MILLTPSRAVVVVPRAAVRAAPLHRRPIPADDRRPVSIRPSILPARKSSSSIIIPPRERLCHLSARTTITMPPIIITPMRRLRPMVVGRRPIRSSTTAACHLPPAATIRVTCVRAVWTQAAACRTMPTLVRHRSHRTSTYQIRTMCYHPRRLHYLLGLSEKNLPWIRPSRRRCGRRRTHRR